MIITCYFPANHFPDRTPALINMLSTKPIPKRQWLCILRQTSSMGSDDIPQWLEHFSGMICLSSHSASGFSFLYSKNLDYHPTRKSRSHNDIRLKLWLVMILTLTYWRTICFWWFYAGFTQRDHVLHANSIVFRSVILINKLQYVR